MFILHILGLVVYNNAAIKPTHFSVLQSDTITVFYDVTSCIFIEITSCKHRKA